MTISTAMIIDDSNSDQFYTGFVLEEHLPDVKIIQAFDGEEALEKLSSTDETPDIIFLDINMPRMNGLEFLEEYSKRDKQAPVIAMLTSSDQENDRNVAMSYDFVKHYFVKALEGNHLEALKEICG